MEHLLPFYLTYPSSEEPIEGVYKGEAKQEGFSQELELEASY